jgi:hypothetical protein
MVSEAVRISVVKIPLEVAWKEEDSTEDVFHWADRVLEAGTGSLPDTIPLGVRDIGSNLLENTRKTSLWEDVSCNLPVGLHWTTGCMRKTVVVVQIKSHHPLPCQNLPTWKDQNLPRAPIGTNMGAPDTKYPAKIGNEMCSIMIVTHLLASLS